MPLRQVPLPNFWFDLTVRNISINETALCPLCLLQTLSHVSLGADCKSLLQLHIVLVLSTLDYGCFVYSSASALLLGLLDPVHHLGLCWTLSAFCSFPVESHYAESGLPSLSHFVSVFPFDVMPGFTSFLLPIVITPLVSICSPSSPIPLLNLRFFCTMPILFCHGWYLPLKSVFLPIQIYLPLSYNLVSLNTVPLIPLAFLSILTAPHLPMALV